ncbi:unnamed protein product, partial [marine sediment metagenome]
MSGQTVVYTAPGTGASVTFSASSTNETSLLTGDRGKAVSSRFFANSEIGTYQIIGTVIGLLDQVEFQIENTDQPISIRHTYSANNSTALPGTLLCDYTTSNCTSGADTHADAAHDFAFDSFAFYYWQYGRNGIDNDGMNIISTVHYDSGYNNAYWNGDQMVYGDGAGFPLADDVVGHELTHGVTDYTSNLFYYYQSGAINESFSDVWGEFVDLTNGAGNDDPGVRWLMGEDITGLGAIRDMSNPPAFGDPDKMTSPYYHLGDLEDLFTVPYDNGGVHTNSGVNNKAVYLMVDGGSFNGYSISALDSVSETSIIKVA